MLLHVHSIEGSQYTDTMVLLPIQIQTQHTSTTPSSPAQMIRPNDQIQSTDIAGNQLARQSLDTLVESDNDEPEIASAPAQSIPEVFGQQSPRISPLASGVHAIRPLQLARSTSNDVGGNSEAGMTQRTTWPRNESGTYFTNRNNWINHGAQVWRMVIKKQTFHMIQFKSNVILRYFRMHHYISVHGPYKNGRYSRRILHWGKHVLYWECSSTTALSTTQAE